MIVRAPRPTTTADSSFTRVRYGSASALAGGRFRGEPTWAHDFPRADFNFLKILGELTFVRSRSSDQGNILTLDDPDLALFPIAYMSEPGFWTMSEAEADGPARATCRRAASSSSTTSAATTSTTWCAQMRRVLPDARFQQLDATPSDVSFVLRDQHARPRSGYYADEGDTEWLGIFEDNDPRKRLLAIANNNHDLGELWEFSDTGYVPVDLSNEAYKFGVNYVMYAMTH